MNIIFKVTRRYLRMNVRRTLTTLVGVILMVMLMTCVFCGRSTGLNYLATLEEENNGGWHATLYDVSGSDIASVEKLDYVGVTMQSKDIGYCDLRQPVNPERPYLFVKRYSAEGFDMMGITLMEGRLPQSSGEIVVSRAAADDGNPIKVGDSVSAEFFVRTLEKSHKDGSTIGFFVSGDTLEDGDVIEVGQDYSRFTEKDADFIESRRYTGERRELTVVGIIEPPYFELDYSPGYTAITLMEEAEASALPLVNVSLRFRDDMESYNTSELESLTTDGDIIINDKVLVYSGLSTDKTFTTALNIISVFMLSVVSLFSALLIYNAFGLSFTERCKYLGMLTSVGATGRQKRISVYYEALVLLVAALPLGVLLGMLVLRLGVGAAQPYIFDLFMIDTPIRLSVSATEILLICLLSAVTVLLASAVPARRVSKATAIDSIRQAGGYSEKVLAKGGVLSQKLFGAPGLLAARNISRSRKKHISVVLSIAACIAVALVCSYAADSIQTYVGTKFETSAFDYHLYSGDSPLESSPLERYNVILDELQANDGISDAMLSMTDPWCSDLEGVMSDQFKQRLKEIVDTYYSGEPSGSDYERQLEVGNTGHVELVGVDDATLKDICEHTGLDFSAMSAPGYNVIVYNRCIVSNDLFLINGMKPSGYKVYELDEQTNLKAGDDVMFFENFPDGATSVHIAGVTSEYIDRLLEISELHNIRMLCSIDTFMKLSKSVEDGLPFCSISFSVSDEKKAAPLLERLEKAEDVLLIDLRQIERQQNSIYIILRLLLGCFVILVAMLCAANVWNSLVSRMSQRSREFASLRSTGMTSRQLNRMLTLEAFRTATDSLLLGAIISTPLLMLVSKLMQSLFGYVRTPFPYLTVTLIVHSVLIIIGLSIASGAGRSLKVSITEQLRDENQ